MFSPARSRVLGTDMRIDDRRRARRLAPSVTMPAICFRLRKTLNNRGSGVPDQMLTGATERKRA